MNIHICSEEYKYVKLYFNSIFCPVEEGDERKESKSHMWKVKKKQRRNEDREKGLLLLLLAQR